MGLTARYALHVLGHLAGHQDRMIGGGEIARATAVPPNYTLKILNQLRKKGFVEARKGWHGGFRIRQSALRRSIRDVVAMTDGQHVVNPKDCAFGFPRCNESHPCPLHGPWGEMRNAFLRMLSETRIRDLADSPGGTTREKGR
jgi:Rrf2 family protein